ncbi:IS1634 family transposase [Nocardia amamiensis]|uniref:IS1634 family transposase n=1 Tax=Nocardia amamiensis TaxID=404578 RepID=UPI00082E47CC|nr:IS1634 family transposase [Nocardia amamiensis]
MVFIRRVRTASGATAVQIAEYTGDRRQRIVAHVGSARTDAELGILLARARELISDQSQGQLDLGVEPVQPRASLVAAPEHVAALFSAAPAAEVAVPVGPGRVTGTCSAVLFDALAGVYDSLGFGAAVADEVFRDLVIARLVEPSSLADAARVLTEMGRRPASYSTLRRTLGRAAAGGYRDRVAHACFAHALTSGDVSLCLYDVTTLYFEAEKEDGLRKVGYSKERRVDPQIVVGLLVDRHGFPLEIGCFEGNKAEKHTIVPIIEGFQARHHLESFVVVADAGMLSAENLTKLDDAGMRFIVGSRVTKAPIDLESHFRWHGESFTDGQVIDTVTPKRGANDDNPTGVRAEPVWDPDRHPGSWRAIWSYSTKRYVRDNRTLNAQEARAREVIDGVKAARAPRFVKTVKGTKALDDAALTRARRLAGLKGYVTNMPADMMSAGEVIASYHDLWHVEQSFRMSKTDLAARPMFARTRDAIEAHLTIVFTALAVARAAQSRTGSSIRAIVRGLRVLRSATITINGAEQTFAPEIPAEQQEILDSLRG